MGAIWGLTLGLLGAVSPAWASPPEPVSEDAPLPSHEALIEPLEMPPIKTEPEPITGSGLMTAGPFLIVGGSVLTGVSVFAASKRLAEEEGLGEYGVMVLYTPLIVVGASTILAGVILLGTGISSHVKYRRWLRARMNPWISLLPGVHHEGVAGVGGLSLGFAGRF